MKKLFLPFIVILIVVFAVGCYKDIQRESHASILIGHTWYIKKFSINHENFTDTCFMSETMTFAKNGTGNHHYATACGAKTDIKFNWKVPNDYMYLYNSNIGGKDSNVVFRIWSNNDDTLVIGGVAFGGQNVYAIYTSFP